MIIVELIEEFVLPVVLMIYVSLLAIALHNIQQRITGTPINHCSIDDRSLAVHEGHQEDVILSNQ